MLVTSHSKSSLALSFDYENYLKPKPTRSITFSYFSPKANIQERSELQNTNDTVKSKTSFMGQNIDTDEIYFKNTLKRISDICYNKFIEQHDLKEKYRVKMVDWMFEVLNAYKQKESTFYRAVMIMDQYYMLAKETIPLKELHLIGIVCMFIASKQEEVKFLKLDTCIKIIGREKFTKTNILEQERKILKVIHYKTAMPSICDLLHCSFRLLRTDNNLKTTESFASRLCIMCMCSYELMSKIPVKNIVICCLIMAIELTENINEVEAFYSIAYILKLFNVENKINHKKILKYVYAYCRDFDKIMPNTRHIQIVKDI